MGTNAQRDNLIQYTIKTLPAECGDCIFISIFDETEKYNILIDGGTSNTYIDYAERPNEERALYWLLQDLKDQGSHIDLLVLSHVDDDHVGGIIEWFNRDFPSNDFVRMFWINDDGQQDRSIKINVGNSVKDSVDSTATLIGKLRKNGFNYTNRIYQGIPFFKHRLFTIKVLAPLEPYHNRIANKIKIRLKDDSKPVCKTPIKDLADQEWNCSKSTSDNNRASIAMQIDINNGDRLLMMGDGHINDIMKGIKDYNPNAVFPLSFKWVKLSHHGSKYNFHPSLTELVNAENYIVSTDGSGPKHPDKVTLAHIVAKTPSNIYFNYYHTIRKKLFVQEDYEDYDMLNHRIRSCMEEIINSTDNDNYPKLVEYLKKTHYDD